jgi:hypothetical protein
MDKKSSIIVTVKAGIDFITVGDVIVEIADFLVVYGERRRLFGTKIPIRITADKETMRVVRRKYLSED